MSAGRFDRETGEYLVTTPRTPAPWINYLGDLRFGGYVDQAGAALLCAGDPATERVTYLPPNGAPGEMGPEAMYLRIAREGGDALLACPHGLPSATEPDSYECRVGPGLSRYVSRLHGLRYEATVFIPEGESFMVREVRIANEGAVPLRVDAVPAVRFSHFDASKQLTNADWVPQTMMSEVERLPDGRVLVLQYPYMRKDGPFSVFCASVPASSWETRRDAFLGDGGYGSWAAPLSLSGDELPCGIAARGDPIAALMLRAGSLAPGGSFRFRTFLGRADTRQAAREAVDRLSAPGMTEAALARLEGSDRGRRAFLSVDLPDPDFADLVGTLLPRQCKATRTWSRYLSTYQTGYGARGIGFRDSCQDLLAWIPQDPEDAASFLLRLLSFQRSDGSAWHQFNPLTLEPSTGDAAEMADRPSWYGDDHLWAVAAACALVRETGDAGFLDRTAPWRDRPDAFSGEASVRDHLERALAFTLEHAGSHGLPLLGYADWNDTINLAAGAESCLCACLFGWVALQLADLYRSTGDSEGAARLEAMHADMKARFESAAWDGSWYAAYFTADGTAMGSASTDGRIFTYAQSWPVIAGFATEERAATAMEAHDRLLLTPRGVKLMWPCYRGYDPDVGGVSTYPPGAKENGGIFLHTNPWAVMAACLRGEPDRAWELFRRINPLSWRDEPTRYRAEPYVFAQNVLGDDHPEFGLARNSWLTGTASWAWVAAVERMLGIRPSMDGLLVDPALPADLGGFTAIRRFRGTEFRITVRRGGERSMSVDGTALQGSLVPLSAVRGEPSVELMVTLPAAP